METNNIYSFISHVLKRKKFIKILPHKHIFYMLLVLSLEYICIFLSTPNKIELKFRWSSPLFCFLKLNFGKFLPFFPKEEID